MEEVEKISIRGNWKVKLLLVISSVALVLGSILVWIYVTRSVEEQRRAEFMDVVEKTEERVQDRVGILVERLYDLRGLLVSGAIDGAGWKKYLSSAGVEDRYPGTYTFAYAPIITRDKLPSFVADVHRDETDLAYGLYAVFPETQNAEVIPVRYLYTKDRDLASMLGYDLGSSENQTEAVKRAVLEDEAVISNMLHLELVIPGSTRVGYELMLPVYSKEDLGMLPKEQRKKYLVGFVGTWLFPDGLMAEEDIKKTMEPKGVSLRVIDGEEVSYQLGDMKGELKISRQVKILDKYFTFEYAGKKQKMLSLFSETRPWLTLFGAFLVIFMWGLSVRSILRSRGQAEVLALEATKDLRKFKQAVEGVSDLVVITDPSGEILYANKSAEKITGYRKESMVGMSTSLWGGQMDEEFYQKFWKTIKEDKKPFWGEVTNKRKNGELYEAEINVSPILDDRGELLFFVGIERDLSRIRAVDQMKTEFISLASHQLRTPLSAVKWFGKMLVSGEAGKLNPLQKEYVVSINESNEREIKLVNSLLNVSKIESGKITLEPKMVNLTDLVASVATDFKAELSKKERKFTVTIDSKVPEVSIDEAMVRHVYINLLSNAFRYTKTGGKIGLRVYVSKNMIVSEVKDNGIGIPRDEQERVFEKFFRASNALKMETDGNGLGLYLARTIVESSGGKMGFRSSEGRGSTFWFSLPVRKSK